LYFQQLVVQILFLFELLAALFSSALEQRPGVFNQTTQQKTTTGLIFLSQLRLASLVLALIYLEEPARMSFFVRG
jgi:hypothetical protein